MKNLSKSLISQALKEDMPHGDLTTDALLCHKKIGSAKLVAKSKLVLSGCGIFEDVFKSLDKSVSIQWHCTDGDLVPPGGKIAKISGPLSSLLKAERVALNFLGHLSGIATLTAKFVKKTKGTHCKITDTRKTTPGLRILEKKAVKDGGGSNHRLNLSDGLLIKENHIRSAGSITRAVHLCRHRHPQKSIEVEVTNMREVQEALKNKVNRIMLDNMRLTQVRKAKKIIGTQALIEVSGNMTLEKIHKFAKAGADFISVGALTHSAPTADLSILHD